jgi:phosphoribosylanthranilate isomerase
MAGVKVKICGITNARDALKAAEFGADFLGFNFYEKSPRKVSPAAAKEIIGKLYKRVKTAGVFVNENPRQIDTIAKYCSLDFVQLHGTETPDFCEKIRWPVIKALAVEDEGTFKQIGLFNTDCILLDAFSPKKFGGTGKQIKEEFLPMIRELSQRKKVFLSGGLTPENVHELVESVRPFAVDVATGVEIKPGLKSHEKMRSFIAEAKR